MLNLLDILFLPSDRGFASACQALEEMHCSIRALRCIQNFTADRSSSLRHLFLEEPVKQPIGVYRWVALRIDLPPLLLLFIFNLLGALLFPSWQHHALMPAREAWHYLLQFFFFICVPPRAGRRGLRPPREKAHPSQASDQRRRECDVTHGSPENHLLH